MYEFLDRLVTVAAAARARFPRHTRWQQGVRRARQLRASGLKEQIIFPEINYDRVDQDIRGMDVVFVTTAKTDAEAKALLKAFDVPFAP